MKRCSRCGEKMPLDAFAVRHGQVVRPASIPEGRRFCRGCQQVKPLSEWAPRRCAICLLRPAVHVDRDHETGEGRGMLCFRCNAALGRLDDDVDRRHRAADCLRGRRLVIRSPHPGVFVIGRTDPAVGSGQSSSSR